MNATAARHRRHLVSMEIPKAHVDAVMEQIGDILGFHVASFSTAVAIEQQMRRLAFDCYTQGLLDGAQVGSKEGR